MQEVMKGASLAFVLRVLGAGFAFAFNVVIARLLGADGAGLYFLALSVTVIGSVIGRVGLDNTLLRFTATHATKGEWGKVKGVYALGMRIAVTVSGGLSLLGFWLAPWMAEVLFHKPELAEPLRWMSLSILPFALLNLQAESLKGLKRIRDAMLVQGIGVPLIGLLLIWPLARVAGVEGAAWAYLAAAVLVALLGVWAWRRTVVEHFAVAAVFPFKDLWASCKPLFVTSLMNQAILPWAPLFLLGIWASSDEVGVFGAATRAAMLVNMVLGTVNNVLAPKFAELYARGETEALGRTARRSALMITLLASPIFLVLFFGGKWVMMLFGPEFAEGALALAILAAGQFVNTLTGSVNHVLIVTGNEVIAICVMLIPSMYSVGAAIATATATASISIVSAYMVWKRLGIVTIPFLRRAV